MPLSRHFRGPANAILRHWKDSLAQKEGSPAADWVHALLRSRMHSLRIRPATPRHEPGPERSRRILRKESGDRLQRTGKSTQQSALSSSKKGAQHQTQKQNRGSFDKLRMTTKKVLAALELPPLPRNISHEAIGTMWNPSVAARLWRAQICWLR